MRFTRMSALVKTTSAFSLVWRYIVCVSHACLQRIKTAFAFFFVWRYNACVSHACLCRLKRLLRFPWCGVAIHAFHTLVCMATAFVFSSYRDTMHAFQMRVCIG